MSEITGLNTEEVKKHLQMQTAILKCVETLRISDNVDEALEELLVTIGEFYHADRSYIYEFDDDMVMMHNTYEWCGDGVRTAKDKMADVEIKTIDRWFIYFEQQGEFYINSRSDEVSEDSEEYRLLLINGVDSLMAAPLLSDGRIVGYIGVDNPRENTDSLLLIQSVCSFVVNELHRRQTVEQRILQTLSEIYISIYLRDISGNKLFEASSRPALRRYLNDNEGAAENVQKAILTLVDEDYTEKALEFYDISTLPERMADVKNISCELLLKSGRWCRAAYIVMTRDKENKPAQVVSTLRYIDQEKKKELEYQRELKKALENKNEIYAEMLHMQGCGMIASEPATGKIITINDAALELFGFKENPGFYKTIFDSIIAEDKDTIRSDFLESLRTQGKFSAEYAIERSDGQVVYVMSEVRLAALKSGEQVMVNSLMDITEKKKLEQELLILSETDSLTGISNRRSGEKKIERLLAEGHNGMFCLMDVDKFKQINDKHGHSTGDKVLVETANCLKKSFRSTDVVMRLGGDEFAVFAVGVEDEKQGEESIKRFFKTLEEISIPEMGDRGPEVSLGAVICTENMRDYEKIYAAADSAMYICKKKKGNFYSFYSEAD